MKTFWGSVFFLLLVILFLWSYVEEPFEMRPWFGYEPGYGPGWGRTACCGRT